MERKYGLKHELKTASSFTHTLKGKQTVWVNELV